MATLPADRTKLALAQSNQVPGIAAGSSQNKNAITEAYDTIDLLNQKVDGLVSSSTLSPYPPAQYNKLINGGFPVNQRAVNGTVTLAAGAYGHDRWKAGASGCTYTFATVNNVTTITITAGSLIQVIEGISLYSGTHTLSWSGTAQGKIGSGSFGVSGVNSSVVGGTNLSIEFNAGTLSNVQFNFGSISLPFQPRSFGEEFQLCRRYCRVLSDPNTNIFIGLGTALNTINASILIQLSTSMRTIPTLVATAGDYILYDGISAATTVTSISLAVANSGKDAVSLTVTVASGLTTFRPYFLAANGANKLIIFDAEL